MNTTQRSGYLKALIDLKNIITKDDLQFYITQHRLATYTCKSHFTTLLNFFIHHVPELITWGDHLEFKTKPGGKLEMISEVKEKYPKEYSDSYKQALKDIEHYFFTCEGRVTKKRILFVIQEFIEEA